jgi:hypothetical protein
VPFTVALSGTGFGYVGLGSDMWVWVPGLGSGIWVWVPVCGSESGFGYVGMGSGMWVWVRVPVCSLFCRCPYGESQQEKKIVADYRLHGQRDSTFSLFSENPL